MALIGKIREKSWLLVAVVGIAMIAFIIPELNFGGGPTEDTIGIGTVNGKMVDENYYNQILQNARQQIFQNKMQQNNGEAIPLDENDERNALSQAWQAIVAEMLVVKEYESIGLIVDENELESILYGQDNFSPSGAIVNVQFFQDSLTGEFDPNLVRQYFDGLEESSNPEAAENLTATLDYVRQFRQEEKYNALIAAGIHTTTLEGKEEYLAQKEVKNVAYAYQNFSRVQEEKIGEISDADIQAYYDENKHLKKFEQKAARKINYFSIPVLPNEEDSARVAGILENLIPRFKKDDEDSLFVMRFSDIKEYFGDDDAAQQPEGTMQGAGNQGKTYPLSIASDIENAEEGDIVGPYQDQKYMAISKIVRFVEVPLATVRHILLSAGTEDEFTAAQKRADSLVRVIRANNNFEAMVSEFSDDPGSVNTGGKYENFAQGAMVPEFNDFSFDKPIGTLGTVRTSYGIHIIEVLERQSPKRPILATVYKYIEPTKSAMDNAISIASSLIYDLDDEFTGQSMEDKVTIFDSFAVNNGYNIRSLTIQDEAPSITGFGNNAESRLFRLAYDEDAAEGDLTSSPIRDKEKVVVALLAEIKEDGIPRFENVKDRMLNEVKRERQAAILQEEMVGRQDLEDLAKEINARYESEGLTFGAGSTAVGREPIIIGTAFSGLLDGETTIPVKGSNGVFVLRVENTVPAPETTDFSTEQMQLNNQERTSFTQRYRTALVQGADVIDNRKLRSFGIR